MDDHETVINATTHNDPISDTAKEAARAFILDAIATITRIDNEIDRLEFIIQDLKQQRSDIVVKIHQYQSTFSPHRAIPSEILAEIFSYCNSQHIVIPWDLKVSPSTVSRVCRKWRAVALGTPSFWREIEVRRPWNSHTIDMTKETIRRSGAMRISMKSSYNDKTQAFLDLIASNLSRFQHLNIEDGLSKATSRLSSGNVTGLETLDISETVENTLFLERATNLRKLSIYVLQLPVASFLRLSSKLTVLEIRFCRMGSDDVLNLLNQCPFIESCKIGIANPSGHNRPRQELRSLILPCLQQLSIIFFCAPPTVFLSHLIMPCLHTFDLSCRYTEWKWQMGFTLALTHSRSLKILRVNLKLSSADLDILLPAVPDILDLELKSATLSAITLKGISDGTLLSQVRCLPFPCEVQTLDALDMHLNMLERRRFPGLRVHLLFNYNLYDPAPAMRRLLDMTAAGWDISGG